MNKWYFFKTAANPRVAVPEPDAAGADRRSETVIDQQIILDGSGGRRRKDRLTGWYRSLVRRRPDRGAGAE
ncbi:hypothetical protein LL912_06130 [Niabella sp. CC-SYL272]|uniref:hypothetical protein n=1 Tax=Niabella agricola TaxID=2891571 RepID=UPI001F26AFAA|nr:hypothetical protein [Niabella agricola]MCF3108350.1 hypothetical protein [Niabella agricola]